MKKLNLTVRFSLAGILTGFFVGICEGAFVLFHQGHARLTEHGVGPAILVLAPLVDALAYGFLGGILGSVAALGHRKFPGRTSHFIALGLAIASAHLIDLAAHPWVHISRSPHLVNAGIALVGGLIVAIATLRYGPSIWPWCISLKARLWPPSWRLIRLGALLIGAVLAGLVAVWITMRAPEARSQSHPNGVGGNRPNLVMIALDTARADHLSAYGYSKPTTPNLDDLAKKGVLFETAIAPQDDPATA